LRIRKAREEKSNEGGPGSGLSIVHEEKKGSVDWEAKVFLLYKRRWLIQGRGTEIIREAKVDSLEIDFKAKKLLLLGYAKDRIRCGWLTRRDVTLSEE